MTKSMMSWHQSLSYCRSRSIFSPLFSTTTKRQYERVVRTWNAWNFRCTYTKTMLVSFHTGEAKSKCCFRLVLNNRHIAFEMSLHDVRRLDGLLEFGGHLNDSWFLDDSCRACSLLHDADDPGCVSLHFLNFAAECCGLFTWESDQKSTCDWESEERDMDLESWILNFKSNSFIGQFCW